MPLGLESVLAEAAQNTFHAIAVMPCSVNWIV
jgi:hypothetical protein